MITIVQARAEHLPAIMSIIESAKGIMRANGNATQWNDGYPSEETIANDICRGQGYLCKEESRIVGYFAFIQGPDPTYATIYNGKWADDIHPYAVVHRVASVPDSHGVFKSLLAFCLKLCGNLRMDTHPDNTIMQHCLLSNSFHYCGVIHVADNSERLAYQKLTDVG